MRGIKNLSLGLGIKHEKGDGKSKASSKVGMKNFQRLNLHLEDDHEDFPIAEENENEGDNDTDLHDVDGVDEEF
jgi:hypothetical protein